MHVNYRKILQKAAGMMAFAEAAFYRSITCSAFELAGEIGIKEDGTAGKNPGETIGWIIGLILKIGQYFGAAVMLWGIVQFAMSLKNDEPESKQKATMIIVAGVVLLTLRSLLVGVGIIDGGGGGGSQAAMGDGRMTQ